MSVVNLSLSFIYLFICWSPILRGSCLWSDTNYSFWKWWECRMAACFIRTIVINCWFQCRSQRRQKYDWIGLFSSSCFDSSCIWYTVSMLCGCMLHSILLLNAEVITCFQLPAQMGSLLGSALALHYLDCVQDESAFLRLNFWLGHSLQEGKFSML